MQKDKIDSYHRHECLDRASMLADMIEEHLSGHPALQPDERALCDKATAIMCELYQLIGSKES